MSAQTKMFLYHQRHRVILLDTSGEYFDRRYRTVYSKTLIAHRGTDNQILMAFVNQDQKRVDVTGKTFTCRIISHDGEKLLLEKPLEAVNEAQGQLKLVLTEQELDGIKPSKVGFSVEQVQTTVGMYEPVYVDDNAGGRGIIDVVDSIMPAFVDSFLLTIPDHSTNTTYYSSILNTEDQDLHTFQIEMDQFDGIIDFEGAADNDSEWYTLSSLAVTLEDLLTVNIAGYHPYIRVKFIETTGTPSEIRVR